jgi:hypothetical protein
MNAYNNDNSSRPQYNIPRKYWSNTQVLGYSRKVQYIQRQSLTSWPHSNSFHHRNFVFIACLPNRATCLTYQSIHCPTQTRSSPLFSPLPSLHFISQAVRYSLRFELLLRFCNFNFKTKRKVPYTICLPLATLPHAYPEQLLSYGSAIARISLTVQRRTTGLMAGTRFPSRPRHFSLLPSVLRNGYWRLFPRK